MINSKQKGKRGELLLVKELEKYGIEAERTAQYNGKAIDGEADVRVKEYNNLHIEVKYREKHNIYDYIEQIKRDKKDEDIGVCFIKSNNKEWLCLLTINDFIKMYKEHKNGS